ncbi:hypothetical protein LSM04_007869 [Trypanosoma melophagium]|uniref:uncharacterized protein n=1 Tax=Trypanosoma melophagium TaxID=715481 RepID=UPI003519F1CC|nr:hypothetical protein LSM04_007869 [Trypanosoma melophagium]
MADPEGSHGRAKFHTHQGEKREITGVRWPTCLPSGGPLAFAGSAFPRVVEGGVLATVFEKKKNGKNKEKATGSALLQDFLPFAAVCSISPVFFSGEGEKQKKYKSKNLPEEAGPSKLKSKEKKDVFSAAVSFAIVLARRRLPPWGAGGAFSCGGAPPDREDKKPFWREGRGAEGEPTDPGASAGRFSPPGGRV